MLLQCSLPSDNFTGHHMSVLCDTSHCCRSNFKLLQAFLTTCRLAFICAASCKRAVRHHIKLLPSHMT